MKAGHLSDTHDTDVGRNEQLFGSFEPKGPHIELEGHFLSLAKERGKIVRAESRQARDPGEGQRLRVVMGDVLHGAPQTPIAARDGWPLERRGDVRYGSSVSRQQIAGGASLTGRTIECPTESGKAPFVQAAALHQRLHDPFEPCLEVAA